MGLTIKANNVTLPSPVEITSGNEVIWSSNTGRGSEGKMLGDVVAEKVTFSITWGILTKAQRKIIIDNLKPGFFPLEFKFDDETVSVTSYRGTITSKLLGYIGDGTCYYRSVSCDLIEQ